MDVGTHVKRPTLLVADLETSLQIYRDILGFTVHHINDSEKDSYSYPVFKLPKHAKIRFCSLDSPVEVRTLALTEVKGVSLPRPVIPHMFTCVIRVKDLPQVMENIKALGLEHTEPRMDVGSHGATFLEQSFVDFDGHLIVIYELTT